MQRRARHTGGFTLLEILVVLMIVGLIGGLSIRGLKALAKSELRTSTARLSGAMRYLFDRASTTGKYHRLVIDLDEGRYWAEVSDDRFYAPREESEADRVKQAQAEARRAEEEAAASKRAQAAGAAGSGRGWGSSFDPESMKPQEFRPKRARFAAFKESTLKPVRMKKTKVVDVYTPRLAAPITSGRAYVYFFPLGQAEAATVHLSDPEGRVHYSLVVHPVTGRVRVYDRWVDATGREDDAGRRAMQ